MEKQGLRKHFESGNLDLETFSHEQHIRLAWLYLGEKTIPETMVALSNGLRHLTVQANRPEVYHETLTCAWVCLIADRRNRAKDSGCWNAFKASNPDLFTDHRALLGRYYSPELLKKPQSRIHFQLPDRLAAG